MKKKIKVVIGIVLIVAFAFCYAHIAKLNNIYDRQVDSSKYIGTGVIKDSLEQEFVSKEETLDGISLKCQFQGDATGTSLQIELVDCNTNETVATSIVSAKDMKTGKFNVFKFDTVEGCKGKTYKVIVSEKNADFEASKGIGLLYQPDTENNTDLTINGNETQGTLIMKTVTNRFDAETFYVLLLFILYIYGFVKFLYKLFK